MYIGALPSDKTLTTNENSFIDSAVRLATVTAVLHVFREEPSSALLLSSGILSITIIKVSKHLTSKCNPSPTLLRSIVSGASIFASTLACRKVLKSYFGYNSPIEEVSIVSTLIMGIESFPYIDRNEPHTRIKLE